MKGIQMELHKLFRMERLDTAILESEDSSRKQKILGRWEIFSKWQFKETTRKDILDSMDITNDRLRTKARVERQDERQTERDETNKERNTNNLRKDVLYCFVYSYSYYIL